MAHLSNSNGSVFINTAHVIGIVAIKVGSLIMLSHGHVTVNESPEEVLMLMAMADEQ